MTAEQTTDVNVVPADKKKIWKIWRTAIVLGIVTAIEFVFAFTMQRGALLISIFVGLTIVKAYFIVSEFMHLKYEIKTLIWAILLPLLFVIWLIIALIYEGNAIMQMIENFG